MSDRESLTSPMHEGPCCPYCMTVADLLASEGRTDDLYAGTTRCCCRADAAEALARHIDRDDPNHGLADDFANDIIREMR